MEKHDESNQIQKRAQLSLSSTINPYLSMSENAFLLKNAIIINEGSSEKGDLLIRDKKIADIFPGGVPEGFQDAQCEVMDLEGMMLLPGLIDDQVHFREPGLTDKGDIHSEARAAVAGGITSYMEMPNTNPPTTSMRHLEEKHAIAAKHSLANFSFYMGATNDNLDELLASDPSTVCGIKVFMGSSTGNMLVDNPASLQAIFGRIKLPVAVHCEDEATVKDNLKAAQKVYGDDIPMFMHALIRSHEACVRSSRLAIDMAEKHGTRLHLLHLSTQDELRLLNNEQSLSEKRITAEACVHHLWFNIDDYADKGSHIKWNPSIKYESDRKALIDGIRNGFIDVLATDHAPHTLEEKKAAYTQCPSGAPMVQHALPAMLTLAEKYDIPTAKIVELMCHNPAICFGVKNRGFIRKGYAADLVVVDPQGKTIPASENILYKCGWSPLEGKALKTRVRYTFVNGHPVYMDGKISETQKGVALEFDSNR